jgi:orotate phosphoribosyltransferase
MNEQKILKLFIKTGAIITNDHIIYTSGKHGTTYINKDAIYKYPIETSYLCKLIAKEFAKDNIKVVIGPAMGGVILSQWTAYHLSKITGFKVLSVYAEKYESKNKISFVIKRGYNKIIPNKNVLVVEDIITTGQSIKKVIEATQAIGGKIKGLGVLCNRGGITPKNIGNISKMISLLNIKLEAWDKKDCPLCKKNIPINTEIGWGYKFLNSKK